MNDDRSSHEMMRDALERIKPMWNPTIHAQVQADLLRLVLYGIVPPYLTEEEDI